MKPDCSQVLTQFASFSVEELSDSEAALLLHHLEECEPCKGQWLLFEKTLTVVTQSGPRDEDVEQVRSQQMWLVCMEHARQNLTKKHSLTAAHNCKAIAGKSGVRADENSENSSALTTSRVSLTIVGGALLMLASSPWLAPRPAAAQDIVTPAKLQVVAVKTTALTVKPLVDYGATLGFKSLSATAPMSAKVKYSGATAKFGFR